MEGNLERKCYNLPNTICFAGGQKSNISIGFEVSVWW